MRCADVESFGGYLDSALTPALQADEKLTSTLSELHRITVDPQQSGGRPCSRNLRIRVKDVLDLLADARAATRSSKTTRYSSLAISRLRSNTQPGKVTIRYCAVPEPRGQVTRRPLSAWLSSFRSAKQRWNGVASWSLLVALCGRCPLLAVSASPRISR